MAKSDTKREMLLLPLVEVSQTGNLMDDMNSDFCSRFRSIKFYNFLHSNRRAPLSFKLLSFESMRGVYCNA